MTVTDVRQDPTALTVNITAEFSATPDQVWSLWADPRRLERWWGPPTYPSTFVEHDLSAGGSAKYYMTGPSGDRFYGWWRVIAVDAPLALEFEDGFSDEKGNPSEDMPVTHGKVTISSRADGRTQMDVLSTFPSLVAMEKLVEMGMVEGMNQALGQVDAILAA